MLTQPIEELANRRKPAVATSQRSQPLACDGAQLTALHEPLAEMRCDNAKAAVALESLLMFRRKERVELVDVLRVRCRKPPRNHRTSRVAIRHRRVEARRVDVVRRQIARVGEVL